MSIARTDPAEFHERQAKLQDAAGAAFASELSTATDPQRRAFLMRNAAAAKGQAEFHRDQAAKLRDPQPKS